MIEIILLRLYCICSLFLIGLLYYENKYRIPVVKFEELQLLYDLQGKQLDKLKFADLYA